MNGPQWLESITEVSGQDPLGIQVISISIYGYLLPGMTNVSSRLRYYTFLCWVLFNYSKKIQSKKIVDWQKYLRKAEFLFALIADMHHINEKGFNSSCVGSETTRQLIRNNKEEAISLIDYTKFEESPKRYFKNKGGGFMQYYQGPMKQLMLIAEGGPLRCKIADNIAKTQEKRFGIDAVEAFSSNLFLDLFHNCLIEGHVTRTQLKNMGDSLCACKIIGNNKEHSLLTNLLFNKNNISKNSGQRRKNTLHLIMHIIKGYSNKGITIDQFLDVCMYEYYPDGSKIRNKSHFKDILHSWFIYQTHEYFSFALQSLLFLFEKTIDIIQDNFDDVFNYIQRDTLVNNISDIHSLKEFSNIDFKNTINLKVFLDSIAFSNEDELNWNNNRTSEYYLSLQIKRFTKEDNLAAILYSAIIILGKIYLKTSKTGNFYNGFDIDLKNKYRININFLNLFLNNNLNNNLWLLIKKIIREFIIERHSIVALRKLRYEKRSTLRFTTENQKYVRTSKINYDYPVHTSPRLATAFNFLKDLGFIDNVSNNQYIITKGGLKFLESLDEI